MAVKRTTPSVGRILALLVGTAGVGFGSTAVAQRHKHEVLERSVRVRVDQRVAPPAATHPVPSPKPHRVYLATSAPKSHHGGAGAKPHHRPAPSSTAQPTVATTAPAPAPAPAPVTPSPAQVAAPALRAPAQAPAPVTQVTPVTTASAGVVSGGS